MTNQDVHVMPVLQIGLHTMNAACWCTPRMEYEEPISHRRMWLHRATNDGPHRTTKFDDPEKRALLH
jgi:hypothetical protein